MLATVHIPRHREVLPEDQPAGDGGHDRRQAVDMTDPNAGETEQRDAQQGEQRPQPRCLALADRNGKGERSKGFRR